MNLKFTFTGSAESSHEHTTATSEHSSGLPVPFAVGSSAPPVSMSSVLEMRVRVNDDAVLCVGVSGDGVEYSNAKVELAGRDLHAAVRSVIARAGAGLPEPLIGSVSAIVLDLDGRESDVVTAWGLTASEGSPQLASVDEHLQTRTGISVATPIMRAENG